MSAKGGSGNFPINVIASQTGLDQVTSALTRFADMMKASGTAMQQQITQMNSLGAAYTNFAKSANTVSTASTGLSNGLKQVGPAAQSVGSALQQAQTRITAFMETEKQAGTTSTQAANSIKTLGPAATTTGSTVAAAGTKLTQFMETEKQLGTATTQAANQVKTLGPAVTSTSSAVAAAGSKLTQFSEAEKLLGTATTAAANQVKTMAPAAQAAGTGAAAAAGQFNTLAASERILAEAATPLNTSLKGIQTTTASLGTSLTAVAEETNLFSTAIKNNAATANSATANTRTYASVLQTTGEAQKINSEATDMNTTSHGKLGDQLIGNAKHVSALGLSFLMLTNSQSGNTVIQGNIIMQQEKIAEDTKKMTEAVKQYGEGSQQAAQAQQALDKDTRALRLDQREATAELHNMLFMYAMIGTEIMSSALPALVHMGETISNVKTGIAAFSAAISGVPAKFTAMKAALTGVDGILSNLPTKFGLTKSSVMTAEGAIVSGTASTGLFSGAMEGLGLSLSRNTKDLSAVKEGGELAGSGLMAGRLGAVGLMGAIAPLAIALAAIGVVVALVATNAFGFRDAMEQAGTAVGNAVPILKPFLEGIQGIGAALGITGESADQANNHFTRMTNGFKGMSTLWNDTIAGMQASNNTLVKSVGDTASIVSTDFTKAFQDAGSQIQATTSTWGQFMDALNRKDYVTATQLIEQSFAALPAIIGTIFGDVIKIIQDWGKGLNTIMINAWNQLRDTLGPIILGIGGVMAKQLMTGLQTAWAGITALVNSSVVQPIQNAVNGLVGGIQNLASAVWTKLGLTGLIAQVTTLANTIGLGINFIVNSVRAIATEVWTKLGLATIIPMATTLATAIGTGINLLVNAVRAIASDVWTKLGLNTLVPQAVAIATSIGNAVSALVSFVTDVGTKVWDALGLQNLVQSAAKLGMDIVNAIIAGITGGAASIQKAITDTVAGVTNPVGKAFGDTVGGAIKAATPPTSGATGTGGAAANDQQRALDQQTQAAKGGTATTPAPQLPKGNIPTTVSPVGPRGPVDITKPVSTTAPNPFQPQGDMVPGVSFPEPSPAPNRQTPRHSSGTGGTSTSGTGGNTVIAPIVTKSDTDVLSGHTAAMDKLTAAEKAQAAANQHAKDMQSSMNGQLQVGMAAVNGLKEKNDKAQESLIEMSVAMGNGTAKSELQRQGYLKQSQALQDLQTGIVSNDTALQVYHQQLASGEMQNAQFTTGIQDQTKKMYDAEAATAHAAGVNSTWAMQLASNEGVLTNFNTGQDVYSTQMLKTIEDTQQATGFNSAFADSLNHGWEQSVQFAAGQEQAQSKLLNTISTTANANGQLDTYIKNLKNGTQQFADYGDGQVTAATKMAQLVGETSNLQGQYSVLSAAMNSAGATQIEFNNGVAQGQVATANMVLSMSEAKGEYIGTNVALVAAAAGMGRLSQATSVSNASLSQWIGVLKGAPDAVGQLIDSVSKFANDAISKVADALNKGKGEVKKAIADIETEIGRTLTAPEKKEILIEAKTEQAVNAIQNDISLAMNFAGQGAASAFHNAMAGAIADAQKQFQSAGGTMKTTWGNILQDMANINADPLNSKKLIDDMATLVMHMEQVGTTGEQARQMLQGMGLTTAQVDAAMAKASANSASLATGLTGTGTGAQQADPMVQAFNATLAGMAPIFGQLDSLASQIFGNLPNYVTTASAAIVGDFSTIIPGISATLGFIDANVSATFLTTIPPYAVAGANAIVVAFATLPGAITPILGQMASLSAQVFAAIGASSIVVATSVTTNYNTALANSNGVLAAMKASAAQVFQAIGASAVQVSVGVNKEYNTAEQDANGYLKSMQAEAAAAFKAIGASAVQVSTGVNTAYRTSEQDSNGYLNSMKNEANAAFIAIGRSAMAVATGVNTAFRQAEADGTGYLNSLKNTAISDFNQMVNSARSVASAVSGIGSAANSAIGDVNSLASAINSVPTSHTTVFRIQTVGSIPAFQFGGNMLVDKPTMFLAGEGMGKERVKVAPGTMGFTEDLSKEISNLFKSKPSGSSGHTSTSSSQNLGSLGDIISGAVHGGLGSLGGLGAQITEWVNKFIKDLFDMLHIHPPGGGGTGGGGTGGGGGGGNPPPIPDRFLKNPNMKNFGVYPIGHPHAGEPILTANPGQVNNGAFEDQFLHPTPATDTGGTTTTTGGTTTTTDNNGNNTNTQTQTNSTGTSDLSQIISQISNISQTSNLPGQNNFSSVTQTNTGANVIPMPGTGQSMTNTTASTISQINNQSNNNANGIVTSGGGTSVSAQTRIIHETPVPVTLEIDGIIFSKKVIKLITEEMSNAGVFG
jgi:hypothetical protein